jgi:hypothetical protein
MFLLQGYFLLYESMLDTVLYARDKYLRPETGILLPDKVISLVDMSNSVGCTQVISFCRLCCMCVQSKTAITDRRRWVKI